MATKTTHVIPAKAKGRWIVKKAGTKGKGVFASQREATEVAKRYIKGKSGQVVVHTKEGKIIPVKVVRLPKLQNTVLKGSLSEKDIEKAVSKVVRQRLATT